jgi:hypothetical protein
MSTELATVEAATPLTRARFEAHVAKEMGPHVVRTFSIELQGKRYVQVAGATALASGCGYAVREVEVRRFDVDGIKGWEATAEIVDRSTGYVIGRGSGIVTDDERPWGSRPQFARRAMASTRAAGRALRLSLGHLFALMGDRVATVTAEEMPNDTE